MPFTATSAPFQSHGLSYTSQPHFLAWLVLVLIPQSSRIQLPPQSFSCFLSASSFVLHVPL